MAQLKDLLVAGPSRLIGDTILSSGATSEGDIIPSVDNTLSLGDSNHKWKIYGVITGNLDKKLTVTLNGVSKEYNGSADVSLGSIYTPTSAGTNHQLLQSNSSGIPTWIPQLYYNGTSGSDYTLVSEYSSGGKTIGFRAKGSTYTLSMLVSSNNVTRGLYDSGGINDWWISRDSTNTTINDTTQINGQTTVGTNATAATTTETSSQLIVRGDGKTVGLELFRGTSGSWQIRNESAVLKFGSNWQSGAHQSVYTDVIQFATNGNITATKFIGPLDGNAGTATTATNLANKPSLAASGTTQITITAGGKTSDAFTVPYATAAGSASSVAWADVTGRPTYWADVSISASSSKATEPTFKTVGISNGTARKAHWQFNTTDNSIDLIFD